jgi:hypothetical protein
MKPNQDQKRAIYHAVEHSLGWSGAPELHSLETYNATGQLQKFLLEHAELLTGKSVDEIEQVLQDRLPLLLAADQYQQLARNIRHGLDTHSQPTTIAELRPGDLLIYEGERMILKDNTDLHLVLLTINDQGNLTQQTLPGKPAQRLWDLGDLQTVRGINSLLRTGERKALPVRRMKDLRVGDLIYNRDGSLDEILDIKDGILTMRTCNLSGSAAIYSLAAADKEVRGVVDRLDFRPGLDHLMTPDYLKNRLTRLKEEPILSTPGSDDAGQALTKIEENLADFLLIVTDAQACTWSEICDRYHQTRFPTRFDRRFVYLQWRLSELHQLVQTMQEGITRLNELLADLPPDKLAPLLPRYPSFDPRQPDPSRYSEFFEQTQHLLLQHFTAHLECTAYTIQKHLEKTSEAQAIYKRLGHLLTDLADMLDSTFQTGGWCYETLGLLLDQEPHQPEMHTRHENNPDLQTLERLSEIAESYRYVDEGAADQRLPEHPQRFDRGITIAESPVEKFERAIQAGAELITCHLGGEIAGFLLYFPPQAITPEMQSAWNIEGLIPTGFLAYTGVDSKAQGSNVYDMLMNAAFTQLRHCGTKQLDLQIFSDNFVSAVAHLRYGARPTGQNEAYGSYGAFKGFSIALDPEEYLLDALAHDPAEDIRSFITALPEIHSWTDLHRLWQDNRTRKEFIHLPEAASRPLEEEFRAGLDLIIKLAVIHLHPADPGRAWKDFTQGYFSQLNPKAPEEIAETLEVYAA